MLSQLPMERLKEREASSSIVAMDSQTSNQSQELTVPGTKARSSTPLLPHPVLHPTPKAKAGRRATTRLQAVECKSIPYERTNGRVPRRRPGGDGDDGDDDESEEGNRDSDGSSSLSDDEALQPDGPKISPMGKMVDFDTFSEGRMKWCMENRLDF